MLNHIYKVGAIVEHDDSGMVGKIIHRGPNYIIMEDGLSGEHRAWLQHVTEMTDAETQALAADTTKDQSNYSADDGGGNTWKAGTDRYREALQNMTPGQAQLNSQSLTLPLEKLLKLNSINEIHFGLESMTLEMLVSAALMDYNPTEQAYILKAIEEDKLPDSQRLHDGVMKVMEAFDAYEATVEGYAGFKIDRNSVAKERRPRVRR